MIDSILEALNDYKSIYFEHYFWAKKFKHLIKIEGDNFKFRDFPRGFLVFKSYDEEDDPHVYISYAIHYDESDEYIEFLNNLFNYPFVEYSDYDDGYYLDFHFDTIYDFEDWLKSIDLTDFNIEFYEI